MVASWTAFDTLATDLWVATVNLRPKLGKYMKGKSFTIERLQHHNYNWEGRVGELLKEKGENLGTFKGKQTAFWHPPRNISKIKKVFNSKVWALSICSQ